MTLRLVVDQSAWNAHVQRVASALQPVVPVVKGNGYGFGRAVLMSRASQMSPEVAVGTLYEMSDVPIDTVPIVLTPVDDGCTVPLRLDGIYTVSSSRHVATVKSLVPGGRVIIKLRSRMQRYGVAPGDVDELVKTVEEAGLSIHGWSIHPPLTSATTDHVSEIASWANDLDDELPIYVSHVDHDALEELRRRFPRHEFRARSGTTLWLGDKSMLKLEANVIDTHPTRGGLAGYRQVAVPDEGTIVLVGCGTAHGIFERPDGLSPFHFKQTRLHLLESPHMHTSMIFIPATAEVPSVGEWIDVQQSMTRALVDTITWK